MAELSVPQVNFSALGELPGIYKQGQADALRQQTLANLGQGGAVDANTLLRSGDLSLAQLGLNLRNRQEEQARQAAQDAESARRWGADYKLRQAQLTNSEDYTPEELSQRRTAQLKSANVDPNSSAGRAFLLTGQYDDSQSKPIPVETIGGTKFLVRGKDGNLSMVDPSTLGQPAAPGAPAQQPFPTQGAAPFNPNGAQPSLPNQAPVASPAASPVAANDPNAVDEKTGRREGYLQTLDPQIQDYIKKVADYEIDPRTTSVKGGMRERLMSAVAKYDPTYNQNDFGARAKAIKDFSTGQQGNIVRSFDVAIDHLDTLQKAADAMKNGDTLLLNKLRNAWRQQTGSDLPTNFQALVPLVSGEIAKAVIGSNNALSDREELRTNLKNANSPDQISGVITGYKGLMSGQLKGLRQQYEATTGKKDFDTKLRKHTLDELSGSAKSAPVVIDGYSIKEN